MSALTNLERQHRKIERERAAGLVRRTVTIPEHRDVDLKNITAEWMRKPSVPSNQLSRLALVLSRDTDARAEMINALGKFRSVDQAGELESTLLRLASCPSEQ